MSTTTNYDMSAANATIPSSEMSTLSSIYIPRVYANLSTEFVAETFESLNLGVVDRVEAVARPGDKTTYMAFVYFASWNTGNKAAVHLAERINTNGGPQARIVYDDPWYWILLPNKSQKSSKTLDEDKTLEEFNRSNNCIPAQEIWEADERRQKSEEDEKELMEELEGLIDEIEFEDALNKQELETEEKMDILFDMIEDLQVRLKVSEEKNQKNEKKIEQLQKELYNVRTILLTGEAAKEDDYAYWTRRQAETTERMSASIFEDMDDEMPSSPPKLVRQNAFVREVVDEEDFYIPSPPKLVRQKAGYWQRESDMMTPPPPPAGPLVRQSQMPAGSDFIPPTPEEVQARMSAEIAAFQKMKKDWEAETGLDWMKTRLADAPYLKRVDQMGLVYTGNDDDKNFWCDP